MLQSLATVVRAARAIHLQSQNEQETPRKVSRRIDGPQQGGGNREQIEEVYGGTQGALLAVASALSGHLGAAERILKERQFDLHGLRSLLDVGSGAGQLAAPLLRYADEHAQITCCDLSTAMLSRARNRLASDRPQFVVADVAKLPFSDCSFDGITCGYVLEHLSDPRPGLAELARVLMPGGKLLLLTMEDNLFGSLTSQAWHCRTHNRRELYQACRSVGLVVEKEINMTRWHQLPWIGGISVELRRLQRRVDRRRTQTFYEKEAYHAAS
jgi:ubiquinone/menaquinone biosynthesis C-methylase UbiE